MFYHSKYYLGRYGLLFYYTFVNDFYHYICNFYCTLLDIMKCIYANPWISEVSGVGWGCLIANEIEQGVQAFVVTSNRNHRIIH